MRKFGYLLNQQFSQMLISPSTYIAAFLFLAFMAVIYLYSLVEVSRYAGERSPTEIFLSAFWIPVLFMVPLLTMRSLSEERRMGTLGTLMTTPVSAFEIVFSKFLAAYFFYALLWLLTLVFPLAVWLYLPEASTDARLLLSAKAVTGYVFVLVSGAMYIAVGIFASSLTRTTFVAGMLSFGMLFLSIIGAGLLSKFPIDANGIFAWTTPAFAYVDTFKHLEEFTGALLDTRPFFFYFSAAAALVWLTSLITEAKSV